MKRIIFVLLCFFPSVFCFAGHIAGGAMYYKYIGPGTAAGTSRYEISLRLFREFDAVAANLPSSVVIAIYNNTSPATKFGGSFVASLSGAIQQITMTPNPCISPPVTVSYFVANYKFTQDLPNTLNGYILEYQTCCRTLGIENMQGYPVPSANGLTDGATYTANIPGTTTLPLGNNSSPVFAVKDTALVCNFSPFTLDFSATDPDADSLVYAFCSAYDRGITTKADDVDYSSPPFNPLTYLSGYSGTQPLGSGVTINSKTGIISGVAPGEGRYVVNVCVAEYRNGTLIGEYRKDFTLRVSACTLTGAALKPSYITCNGTTLSFQNESTNSNVNSYLWDFGVPSLITDTSTSPTPTYDYLKSGKDSGTYTVKLKVATVTGCQDSTTATVKVYPGFTPGFIINGTCVLNNYLFSDTSKTKYGTISSRLWDFGDATTLKDTARSKDSAWKYPSSLTTQVRLIVANSVGCIDTVTKSLTVLDKPTLSLPFRDTLICSIDSLLLRVNIGSGSVVWTPMNGPNKTRILNATTATPLVFPKDSTKYYVSVNDNGCANTDSVMVNVLKFITVQAVDTAICRTDTIRLRVISDALSYQWTSSTAGEKVESVKYPLVRPLVNTTYSVIANLGKCQANTSLQTIVEPYPNSFAGSDVTICYGSRTQLTGTVTGSAFSWSPKASLINENTLTPTAGPTKTTTYILTATNTVGCLKPKTDTIIVTVIPPIIADAGKDTSVIPGQTLQLSATGGTSYEWSPGTGLSNPFISNPVATFDNSADERIYKVTVSNGPCSAADEIKIRIFKTGPDILVPSAFTPNGDGKNDVIRPILLGITKLTFFSIYNRWGQLLFTTTEENKGWNGMFSGVAQPSGTYVYQAVGIDFLGKTVLRKGTVVLIR